MRSLNKALKNANTNLNKIVDGGSKEIHEKSNNNDDYDDEKIVINNDNVNIDDEKLNIKNYQKILTK